MKRLAIFLDGTWNTVESRTNVSRLRDAVAPSDGPIEQRVYYEPGVGVAMFEKLRGGMLGYGLDRNVVAAYGWLFQNYADGDEIHIFGFSRGAYTARSLAGMIAKCGLLRPGASLRARELFDRYQLSGSVRPIYEVEWAASQGAPTSEEERQLLRQSRRVEIKLIAVWDTVGALGIPFGNIPGLSRRDFQFHHTRLSNLYGHAYQALAIDEHRRAFEPALWTRFTPRTPDTPSGATARTRKVEQRWFVGAHADVGGGNSTALPDIPLAWIAGKAEAAGLRLHAPVVPAAGAQYGPVTDSFGSFMFGLYRLAKLGRPFVRTIGTDRVAKEAGWVDTVAETIDGSVFDRHRADARYRPKAIANWSAGLGLDPARIEGPVDVRTGRALPS